MVVELVGEGEEVREGVELIFAFENERLLVDWVDIVAVALECGF